MNKDHSYEFTIAVTFYKNLSELDVILNTIKNFIGNSNFKIEVILINDSADKSNLIVEDIPPYNLKIYNLQKNKGVTGARNYAYTKSNAEFILFLDSDDLLLPNMLGKVYDFIKNNFANVYFFRCLDEKNNIVGIIQEKTVISNTPNLFYGTGERLICLRKNKHKPFINFLRGNENTGLLYYTIKSKKLIFCWADFPVRLYLQNFNGLSSKINTFNRSFLITIGHFLSAIFSFYLRDFKWSFRFLLSFIFRFFITIISSIKYLINIIWKS